MVGNLHTNPILKENSTFYHILETRSKRILNVDIFNHLRSHLYRLEIGLFQNLVPLKFLFFLLQNATFQIL